MKPHEPLQPAETSSETTGPAGNVDDGRAGRVPFSVSDGDFSTPTRRKRTITQPRGLRALEAPVDPALFEMTEPVRESVPTPPPHAAGVESGMSAVDEFLTSPPTPAPETELTPRPDLDEPLLSEPSLGAELTPASASFGVSKILEDLTDETTPLPDAPTFPGAPVEGEHAAFPAGEDVTFDLTEPVIGATPQPAVQSYSGRAPPDVVAITPASERRGVGRDAGPGFSATEAAEAELEAAVDAVIPGFMPGPPVSGSVPIVENASAGAEMRLAALGSLPVTRERSPDLDQVARDEALVDDLLRRATQQILGEHQEGESPSLFVESPPGRGSSAELSQVPPVNATEVTLAVGRSDVESAEVAEPPVEPSLSPLAQTLAHMAEALHSDLATDGGIEIDIVDAPLIPPVRGARDAGHAPASPPPIPTLGSPIAAKAVAEQPVLEDAAVPEALEERPRRPRRSKPWYEEVFDENYLRTLPFMTPEQTLREVDFIEASLATEKGSRVLDVGCGYGRHAIELVQHGLAVTGLDLSLPLLIRAADESQKRALTVNFVHSDMRSLAFDSEFDSAYCMLTSFGYFDEETNLKVAEGIARALKPGGRFLLDVVNRDYIVSDLPARIWWEGDGCVVLEEVEFNFNTSRILTHRSVVFEDGRQLDQEISVRAYSLHELGKLLRNAGFRVLEASGSVYTPGSFFGAASRSLVILAERRAD